MMEDSVNAYLISSCRNNGTSDVQVTMTMCIDNNPESTMTRLLTGFGITNQRADLLAIKWALDIFKEKEVINIYSRSQYAVNCVTIWGEQWRSNNWSSSSSKNIKNVDIIKSILDTIILLREERKSINIIFVNKNNQNEAIQSIECN